MGLTSFVACAVLATYGPLAAAQVSPQRAIEALTCTGKNSREVAQTLTELGHENHVSKTDGMARTSQRYEHRGICLTDAVMGAAMGFLYLESRSCSQELAPLQIRGRHFFTEAASDAELKAEQAFFMRKRGADALSLSGDRTGRGRVTVICWMKME